MDMNKVEKEINDMKYYLLCVEAKFFKWEIEDTLMSEVEKYKQEIKNTTGRNKKYHGDWS